MRIQWQPLAIERVAEIAHFIALDNPAAARAWRDGVFAAVKRLEKFPKSGAMLPEYPRDDLRQIVFGDYRIIYRIERRLASILTVRHGSRLLPESEVEEG